MGTNLMRIEVPTNSILTIESTCYLTDTDLYKALVQFEGYLNSQAPQLVSSESSVMCKVFARFHFKSPVTIIWPKLKEGKCEDEKEQVSSG